MAKETVLIIEDEADIIELVSFNLKMEGYQVSRALSGEEGLRLAKELKPNIILLDLMLPGLDGLEVCRQLRRDPVTQSISIIMLTAKGEDFDVVTGLEVGADDYISKPFSPKVLVARVRSVLRRKDLQTTDLNAVIAVGDLIIHPGRREVTVNGKPVPLTYTEFGLLHLLARKPGWVFNRYQIVNEVRGEDVIVTDRAVDVQIVGLRKKLGAWGDMIETVRGVGYRLRE